MKKKYEFTPEEGFAIIKKKASGEPLSKDEYIKFKIAVAKIEVASYSARMRAARDMIKIAEEGSDTVNKAMGVISDLVAEDINDEVLQNAVFAIEDLLKYIKNTEMQDMAFAVMVGNIVKLILGASQLLNDLNKQQEEEDDDMM